LAICHAGTLRLKTKRLGISFRLSWTGHDGLKERP
jgi:hypothetical protein